MHATASLTLAVCSLFRWTLRIAGQSFARSHGSNSITQLGGQILLSLASTPKLLTSLSFVIVSRLHQLIVFIPAVVCILKNILCAVQHDFRQGHQEGFRLLSRMSKWVFVW